MIRERWVGAVAMGIENKRGTQWRWIVSFVVFVGMFATVLVVVLLLPTATWGLSAWPLYLGAALILAWVIMDVRTKLKARGRSVPTNETPPRSQDHLKAG